MNFDEAIKRLNDICAKLKDESTPLEESVVLYKEGIELSAKCRQMLDGIKKELEVEFKKVN